jgi:hypothetical protein
MTPQPPAQDAELIANDGASLECVLQDANEAYHADAAELVAGRARIAALTAQLPDGMKHCTIVFKECDKGHGRLTATNWIDHGCDTCRIAALTAELARVARERDAVSLSSNAYKCELARVTAERDEAIDGMAHYQVHDYQETKRANTAERKLAQAMRELVAVQDTDAFDMNAAETTAWLKREVAAWTAARAALADMDKGQG